MDTKRREANTERQEVQVDACPEAAGLILSVGAVSIWLEIETAKQVAVALRNAISPAALAAASARNTGQSN
jgi:Zn-finger nucleic acid-binding protein